MFKKTKVVATLGPSCSEDSTIRKMVENGVDVFRINFSHADHKNVEKKIKIIRSISKELKVNISILADLQGPKLRIGLVDDGSFLKVNDEFDLYNTNKFTGNSKKAFINYAKFASDVNVGEKVLLDDGKIILEIKSTNKKDYVKSKVIQGGELKSKRGVNLPNTKISLPALTDKDISDVIFAINNGVDWIALSFVRNQSDLVKLKEIIEEKSNHRIPIIAKIEKPEAIENIDEIIKNCDGIMVARGDLGVEVPAADVPLLQKKLVIKAKKQRIPVIIATQMMETMINKPTATRAEVNDVANSVMDGADAVMLSGETSIGKYPVEVVKTITSILKKVENSPLIKVALKPPNVRTKRFITKSVCYHAAVMSNEIDARAICTLTNSGYTAFQISSWRPNSNILVFTSNKRILSQLNLLWGVKSFFYDKFESTDNTIEEVNSIAKKEGYIKKGDMLINLASMPISNKGMVNTMRISQL